MRTFNTVPANKIDVLAGTPCVYGEKVGFQDGTEYVCAYWDGAAPAALAVGDLVFVGAVGKTTASLNPAVSAAATSAVSQVAGVVVVAPTAAGACWVQTKGICDVAKLEGTTDIAIGDMLQAVNAQTYLVKDGGTSLTADSIAVSRVAYAADEASTASKSILLLGRQITIG
jgi:hypothetical protein